jgi:molecular chaperone GrpE
MTDNNDAAARSGAAEEGAQATDDAAEPAKKEEEEAKIAECEKARDGYLAGWQRAKADYQNLQKEIAERITQEFEAGKRSIIKEMLPTADDLAIAQENMPAELRENTWAKGIEGIFRNLEQRFAAIGIEAIEAMGKSFDPMYHESLESRASEEPEGTVIEEMQKGYLYKGRVLRPARVKISGKSQIA